MSDEVTAESLTDEQIRELRRETLARWNMGEFVPRAGEPGETLTEQLDMETAALRVDGGHVGPPNYRARRVTQAEARIHCAVAINARRGAKSVSEGFKPSEIGLAHFPPLVDTMGRTEAEIAAALLVRACQEHGDVWQDIDPRMVGQVIVADIAAKREPVHSLNRNPFCKPDFHDLVKRGFAQWVGEAGGPLRFTQRGLDAIARHGAKL